LNNNASSTQLTFFGSSAQIDDFNISPVTIYPISSSSIQVNWTVDKLVASKILYKTVSANFVGQDTGTSLTPSAILTGLTPGQNYAIEAYGKNNSVEKYSDVKFITMPNDDSLVFTTKPALSIRGATSTIVWSTNLLSVGKVKYRNLADSDFITVGSDDNTLDKSVVLANLKPGKYEYYTVSSGAMGDLVQFPAIGFEIATSTVTVVDPAVKPIEIVKQSNVKTTSANNSPTPINNAALFAKLKGEIILKLSLRVRLIMLIHWIRNFIPWADPRMLFK
jgi:hypothetical protein